MAPASAITLTIDEFKSLLRAGGKPGRDPQPAQQGWLCRFTDCPSAVNERVNFHTRARCLGCARAKATAMSPPAKLAVPPAEPTRRTGGGRASAPPPKVPGLQPRMRPRRRSTKKEEAADKEEPAPTTSTTSLNEPRLVGKTFKDMLVAQVPLVSDVSALDNDINKSIGITPLAPLALDEMYRHPDTSEPPKLSTIDELAAKSPHLELTDALASKKAAAARARGALASLSPDDVLYQTIQAELDKQNAEIAKLTKKAPTPAVLTERLKTVQQEQILRATAQGQNAANGRQKAAERLKLQLDAIDQLGKDLVERRRAIVQAHTDADLAWSAYRTKQKAQWDKLLADFAAEILKQESSTALADMETDNSPDLDGILDQAAADVARATKLAADAALAQQRAAALQVAAAVPVPAEASPLYRTIECTPQELPQQLPELQPQQWPFLHQLWCALETINKHEALVGWHVPITLGQLRAGPAIPKLILGEALWARAFPEGEPAEDTVLPLQVRNLIMYSLQAHRGKLLEDKTRQDAAQAEVVWQVEKDVQDYRNKRPRAAPQPAVGAA